MEVRPGYKQTDNGVIPGDWDEKPFVELFAFRNGVNADKEAYGQGVRFINVLEPITHSHIHGPEITGRVTLPLSVVTSYDVRRGDILFNRTSETQEEIGLAAAYLGSEQVVFGGFVIRGRPIDGSLDPIYAGYALRAPYIRSQIIPMGQGAIRANISQSNLRLVVAPVPPLPEQRAIAAALSDLDALLDALNRLIAKKRDLKQAAMQQLLTGKTRLPGFVGEWRVMALGDLITHCVSGATPRRNRPDFYSGDIRWITSGELNYNVISDTNEKITSEAVAATNLTILPKGTFLMAITGLEAAGTRGSCGVVGEPSTTNQSCMAIFPNTELLATYLFHYYVFRGDELALRYCQGTKQQSYTAGLVKALPIDVPPTTHEQAAIAAVLTDMDAELSALERRLSKTRALKQGVMQELLTGRTRLASPEMADA